MKLIQARSWRHEQAPISYRGTVRERRSFISKSESEKARSELGPKMEIENGSKWLAQAATLQASPYEF